MIITEITDNTPVSAADRHIWKIFVVLFISFHPISKQNVSAVRHVSILGHIKTRFASASVQSIALKPEARPDAVL